MKDISRRDFLKILGAGTVATAATMAGCQNDGDLDPKGTIEPQKGQMTYRTNPKTGDKVSLLGFGMMRLPVIEEEAPKGASGREASQAPIDQEMINKMVDKAIEYGVNYFDTAPVYCQGRSEKATGIALSRHKRSDYFIATKMSNFAPGMFYNSLKELQTDYIDYMLLHSVGGGKDGMENLRQRYYDNGILDFLLEQREKGVIRNLGFSYHGDVKVFDYLLSRHDEYKWDFVQIEMNYLDWHFAHEIEEANTNADYLYNELTKRNIPAVIMEPLLGGRLANLPDHIVKEMKTLDDTLEFYIVGAADSLTGTIRHNQWLSERRSEAAYNMLVNNYRVNANQLIRVNAGGIDVYDPKENNRMAMVIQRTPVTEEIVERWLRMSRERLKK